MMLFDLTVGNVSGKGDNGSGDAMKDHCNKTVDIYEDVSSPELTIANRYRPLLCTYRFRSFRGAPRDWVLRLRFKKFKIGTIVNATHCNGGYLQVQSQMKPNNISTSFTIAVSDRRWQCKNGGIEST